MSPGGGEVDAFVRSRIERILQTSAWDDHARVVVNELYEFFCQNPLPAPASSSLECIVANDNYGIPELVGLMLSRSWERPSSVVLCTRIGSVIQTLRDRQPGVLVITTNMLLPPGWNVIAACAAVSTGTRYLILTGWNDAAVAEMRQALSCLQIRFDVLSLPFSCEQLVAALNNLVL